MKYQASHSEFATLGKLAISAGRAQQATSSYGDVTRRQKKHDMLVTFMANTKQVKRKPTPVKPRLLTALLSIFF